MQFSYFWMIEGPKSMVEGLKFRAKGPSLFIIPYVSIIKLYNPRGW